MQYHYAAQFIIELYFLLWLKDCIYVFVNIMYTICAPLNPENILRMRKINDISSRDSNTRGSSLLAKQLESINAATSHSKYGRNISCFHISPDCSGTASAVRLARALNSEQHLPHVPVVHCTVRT